MSAEELRHQRDVENQARRIRQAWVAALGGRLGLAAPLARQRTKGGVQQPSIGVAPTRGEMPSWHYPGVLALSVSDPRLVLYGGKPRFHLMARIDPTSDVEFQAYKNGAGVGSAFTVTTFPHVEDVDEQYDPGDTIGIAVTSIGTGGTEGVVAVAELLPRLMSS